MINKLFEKNWVAIDKILCEFNNEFCAKKGKNLKQEFNLWKKNLTKEEIKALKKYRRGTIKAGKRNINAYLREGILNDKDKNKEVSILKGALSKARLKENIATYRTISIKEHEFMKGFEIGDEINNMDFKGTHATRYIHKSTTAAYAVYLIPKGYECAYINYWLPLFMFEKELLLNCGSKCKLADIKTVFGKDCYILKVQ